MKRNDERIEGRDLLLGRPEGASRAPPGVSSELIRAAEELRQAVEELRSAIRERDEELLRKILAAAQAAEPRPDEELLRELLEALRTLPGRAEAARPGDSAVAENTLKAYVRELGERVFAARRAADAATEAVAALRGQTVAAREAFEETARRVGTDVAGLREASAKYERAARAASEEVLRRVTAALASVVGRAGRGRGGGGRSLPGGAGAAGVRRDGRPAA